MVSANRATDDNTQALLMFLVGKKTTTSTKQSHHHTHPTQLTCMKMFMGLLLTFMSIFFADSGGGGGGSRRGSIRGGLGGSVATPSDFVNHRQLNSESSEATIAGLPSGLDFYWTNRNMNGQRPDPTNI